MLFRYTFNSWQHIVVTFKNGVLKLYQNNSLKATYQTDRKFIPVNSLPIQIGRSTVGNYFIGKIDDIRIYNRALSETEIQQLYQL
ncbi:LamG domain-containing protein [Thermoflexibacter ruber]|uniref:Concanavalin A-like lectin/glucanases superfamily protein n=1 Tax=Thermoflexibacter ruber TaxID=1003 RepID=A0A1I2K084_9BACT|nr:LamG domain-containing protein [Thermoflexibacter ruber]SFF59600.1 Concanavalin A-like lectin/glucanases superfamily protein [Thermoflexibacter ruber]